MSNIKDVDIDDIKNEFKNISVKCGILMKSNGRTENYLNEVYGRIGISFEVTVEDFESEEAKSFLADGLDVCGASGFMTASTGEMRQLKQLYMDSKGGSVDEKRLYLFLVDEAQCAEEGSEIDPSAVCGDIPRNSKVGFLFAKNNAADRASFNRTVAHELGHGAFAYEHPFDNAAYKTEQGATRNLMDYVTDDDLAYFQWQSTLGLNLTWGFLEGDESGMMWKNIYWFGDNEYKNGWVPDSEENLVEDQRDFYLELSDKIDFLVRTKGNDKSITSIENKKKNLVFKATVPEKKAVWDYWGENGIVNTLLETDTPKLPMGENTFLKNKTKAIPALGETNIVLLSYSKTPDLKVQISKLSDMAPSDSKVKAGFYFDEDAGKSFGFISFYSDDHKAMDALLLVDLHEKENISSIKSEMSQWIDFFLLKRQKVEIIPNQISGHYIVYKSDANERDESKNYAVKNGVFVPQGTEVTKESEVSVGSAEVWKIKSVDDGKEYWTTGTNLMEIKVLTTPEEVTLECGYSVQLPYTSNATTTKPTNGLKCTKIATCGEGNDIYFRVSSSELPEFGTSTNSKGYWCFDWRTKPHLTASEIAAVRTVIQSESDATKKGDDFLLLQEKVPYHNQRDNVSTATQVDINLNSWITSTSQTIGDIMCNLTSEVMALEYLGLSKDSCVDDRCSANCTQAQFEDFLECQIRENGFARRNEPTSRESLASLFGVTQTTYTKEGWNESFEKKFSWSYDAFSGIRDEIRNGLGVIMSVFGHIVRIQSISEDGITVDDPYGSVTYWSASGATPKYKNSTEDHRNSKTSTSEDQEGNNCLWVWSDLSNNSISFNRIEAYSK